MKTIKRIVDDLVERQVSGFGLGLFRICFGTIMFLETIQLFFYRELIFTPMAGQLGYFVRVEPVLLLWLVAQFFWILGYHYRLMSILNYLFVLGYYSVFGEFEYHVDYNYIAIAFGGMWMPMAARCSVDAVRSGEKRTVSDYHYVILLLTGVGLVYLESIFHKLGSPMWRAGLGFWLPASLPNAAWLDLSPILDNKALSITLGYATILLETVFAFIVFNKKLRTWMWPGVFLHIGIFIAYPIPYFAIGETFFYILVFRPETIERVTLKYFGWLEGFIRNNNVLQRIIHVVDTWMPQLTLKTVSLLWRKKLAFVFVALMFGAQGAYSLAAAYPKHIWVDTFGIESFRTYKRLLHWTIGPLKPLTGMTTHAVFMDSHFDDCHQQVAVTYRDASGQRVFLPMTTKNGLHSMAANGRMWVNWNFFVACDLDHHYDSQLLVERYTRFWADRGYESPDGTYEILRKRLQFKLEWRAGALNEVKDKPWEVMGEIDVGKKAFKAVSMTVPPRDPEWERKQRRENDARRGL